MSTLLQSLEKESTRTLVPLDFKLEHWEGIAPYYEQLLQRPINSKPELIQFLHDRNELDAIVSEEYAWRYIRKTRNTQDADTAQALIRFIQEVIPAHAEFNNKLNRKIVRCPFLEDLDTETYLTYVRNLKQELALFREANIPLLSEEESLAQQHGIILSEMSILHQGQTLTLQAAGKLLEDWDRSLRHEIWEKIVAARQQEAPGMQTLFEQLLKLRTQIARNADFDSYSAYKFEALGRFDYSQKDVHHFHQAVEDVITPIYQEFLQDRKRYLGVDELRPWDLVVDYLGQSPLQPFPKEKPELLLSKTIQVLSRIHPELGEMIEVLNQKGFLDLETRVGKQPGGYNYPLMETGLPFIFMNAAGTQSDVITLLHESGHAVHSFLTRDIPLNVLKNPPAEVAELASMTMELFGLEHYDAFYDDPKARIRAQKTQLMRCLSIFPWIATVDAFQQWVYDHPDHKAEERNQKWDELYIRFHGNLVNWEGHEEARRNLWLKQVHIFEIPFYYIEYAIAQLGSLAIWKNYIQQPAEGLNKYLKALKLGYTKTIPEIYRAAGIQFDFSADYIRSCGEFCLQEYQKLSLKVEG